jgi:hypothetical protein
MTAKVIRFTGITTLDLEPEVILDSAKEAGLEGVVVLGFREDGSEYFASSYADGGTVLWLMEKLKKQLLEVEV